MLALVDRPATVSGPDARRDAPKPSRSHQVRMLADSDSVFAANKRLVYDFWREVLEAGHVERAAVYLADGYIQHTPEFATARDRWLAAKSVRRIVLREIQAPLAAIIADEDLVVLSFMTEQPDARDPSKTSVTSWFDMFRIGNGRIVERWNSCARS